MTQRPSSSHVEAPELGISAAEDLQGIQRLIVLVPARDLDEIRLARRIWEQAGPRRLEVLFVGLCREAAEEYRQRRKLVTLVEVTRDTWVRVGMRLTFGGSWVRALRGVVRPGDVVLCHREQRVGLARKPLAEALRAYLGIQVEVLFGFYSPPRDSAVTLLPIVRWASAAAILLGFFWFQIQVPEASDAFAQRTLLLLSLPIEIGLFWIWSRALL